MTRCSSDSAEFVCPTCGRVLESVCDDLREIAEVAEFVHVPDGCPGCRERLEVIAEPAHTDVDATVVGIVADNNR